MERQAGDMPEASAEVAAPQIMLSLLCAKHGLRCRCHCWVGSQLLSSLFLSHAVGSVRLGRQLLRLRHTRVALPWFRCSSSLPCVLRMRWLHGLFAVNSTVTMSNQLDQ